MYNWAQKSLSNNILNKKLRTRNTVQYEKVFFLFKVCLPQRLLVTPVYTNIFDLLYILFYTKNN